MHYSLDEEVLTVDGKQLPLYSEEAFAHLSKLWLKVGWNLRYHYTFTWMGQPALQLPEDLIRLQEVIWALKPDLIVETGVAFGGSLLFYATLCQAMNKGRALGVDVALRDPNRSVLENHPLKPWFECIDGSSTDPETLEQVSSYVKQTDTVLVILDSNHSYNHVLRELMSFAPFVTPGSYLIATDGIKKDLTDAPRGKAHWSWDNPCAAVRDFLKERSDFILEPPERRYNRSLIRESVTHFPEAWLKKIS